MPTIDQNDVEAVTKAEILESVVENEGVAVELTDGVLPAFDAVFVDDHGNVLETGGEHVGRIPGSL